MVQSDAQCGSSSLSPVTVGGQSVAASVSEADEPPVQSSLGPVDWIQWELPAVPSSQCRIDTALTVCSASVGPVVEAAATVVAIFGDSEQSGSRAQQCQRSQSAKAILRKNSSNSAVSAVQIQFKHPVLNGLSERSDKRNSVLRKHKKTIYTAYIYIFIYTVCVCAVRAKSPPVDRG